MKKLLLLTLILMMGAVSVQAQNENRTITEVLSRDPNFSLFVAAAEASGLADDLDVPSRRYTVFAPTNASFNALLQSLGVSQQQLFGDRALIRRIVQYHIIGEDVTLGSAVLQEPLSFFTFSNDAMTISFVNNRITINDGEAVVTFPNVFARNGIIHVINSILLPPGIEDQIDFPIPPASITGAPLPPTPIPPGTILGVADARGDLNIFVAAVQAAGLDDELVGGGPFTVFAPRNGAFNTLLNNLGLSQAQLLADTTLLNSVLTYHVVPQRLNATELFNVGLSTTGPTLNGAPLRGGSPQFVTLPTVNGTPLPITATGGQIKLDNETAVVVERDLFASNGVIHILDNVLLP